MVSAAHDGGDGVVALLGPVDAGAVPRPGGIRPGPIGRWTRLAPLVDGPAQVGRLAPHGRDRAIGILMGGTHHGLCPNAVAVHGLALGGFQNPEFHLVEQQPRGVGPSYGGL